jgi:ABC-2 type transport system permease protein
MMLGLTSLTWRCGGSIEVPGFDSNTQLLMPGIFAQTVVFGSSLTAIGIAEDMSKGFTSRLRSLPIAQSSVLIGRTVSDLLRNCITFAVMPAVAFLVVFRFNRSLFEAAASTATLLLFAYSNSWV